MTEKDQTDTQTETDQETNPLVEYLKTEKGHQLASKIIGIIDDLKKAFLGKKAGQTVMEKWQLAITISVIVFAVTLLTLMDRLDPSVAILFGTIFGYLIGKKNL